MHVLHTRHLQNIELAQGWPNSITTTSHTQRGSCQTPKGTQLHPTLHVLSSYQPSTILKPAKVRRLHSMLNESHVARPKSFDTTPPSMFCPPRNLQNIGLAQGREAYHNNVPHSTRFMPHARRHPAPPHLACFIIVPAAIHSPHTRESQLEGNIVTFRAQQGSCRTPKGTRFQPAKHVLAPPAFKT